MTHGVGDNLGMIKNISIDEEMERSYLSYSMSVIVSRALPDARDGLKPVHRRTIYAMDDTGLVYNKPYRKCARIVGEVMSKYHPHGDVAAYDSLVRMAQTFSLLHPLVDGQGNFGSIDGDSPAAMRYTEARPTKLALYFFKDIKKDTVEFVDNYDGSEKEPKVLPVEFPNILVNGSCGVAVGMATNIPPHNLREVIDACLAYIANVDITTLELLQIVKAPDFPTGGQIIGLNGFRQAMETGRGIIKLRGVSTIEKVSSGRNAIVITEIPYQVNKAKMVEKIAELVKEKKVEGIADLRDESDKSGIRVVVEIKRDMTPEVVLNQLYSHTLLQTSFGINMLALDKGYPKQMGLKEVISIFVAFRKEVVERRTTFELRKARDRMNVLTGLYVAILNIDLVVEIIRNSGNPAEATRTLLAKDWIVDDSIVTLIHEVEDLLKISYGSCFKLNEEQVKSIMELRLYRLTKLEKETIYAELQGLMDVIRDCLNILSSHQRIFSIISKELEEVRDKFQEPRRTQIIEDEMEHTSDDSLINKEDVVITITMRGYIKRVSVTSYRAQHRGGKGRMGTNMHDDDVVIQIFAASTHSRILFFSNLGRAYQLKTYNLPSGDVNSRGKALVNFLNLSEGESITSICPMPEDEGGEDACIMFVTRLGRVRRNRLADFANIKSNGKIAIKLEEEDRLIGVSLCNEQEDLLLVAKNGKCIRFPVSSVRIFKGRDSDGVTGMKLPDGDNVVSLATLVSCDLPSEERAKRIRMVNAMRRNNDLLGENTIQCSDDIMSQEQCIFTVTENGFGKRTSAYEYRTSNRGGLGIQNISTSHRNGSVLASMIVSDDDHIILITDKGKSIRIQARDVKVIGRSTQGVSILKVASGEKIISMARIIPSRESEDEPQQDSGSAV